MLSLFDYHYGGKLIRRNKIYELLSRMVWGEASWRNLTAHGPAPPLSFPKRMGTVDSALIFESLTLLPR
jgi:hypothetical protein